ncbi:MAG TPA: DUF502 domain-containing protein [Burkholderiales bacterium]|nr:DUF502 domain-containing protein [Burkholderiales bacterium]
MKAIGRIFLTGMLTVLPVLATVYFAIWTVTTVERFVGKQIAWLVPDEYYRAGMGLALAIVVIFFIGLLMHALLFRRLFGMAERLLLEIPLVRSIYAALRDLFGLFAEHQEARALQVVSVELPGGGMRLIGFVTRRAFEDLPEGVGKAGEIAVYLPMSYQIGGYTVFLPQERVTPIAMSREEAMKFVLTAGLKSSTLT